MTFVITDPCIDTTDQSCVQVCPVDCIHFEEGADRILYINPTDCIDCGACQPACPVSAIFPEAEVPVAAQRFIQINELWYADRAAARALVGGGAGAAPAPAGAPAAAATPAAPAAQPVPAPAAAPARAAAPPPPQQQPAIAQVSAAESETMPAVSTYRLPSPVGVIALALFGLAFVLMWLVPGPGWLKFGDSVRVGATIVVLVPLAILCALIFIVSQAQQLGRFAASHERRLWRWRRRVVDIRRNEESRRYQLAEIVQAIARERFAFPNAEYPDLRTYVNLPEPTMALEPRGSGEKLFPDILAVAYPGNYPVAVAQVESRETVTREQARYVWSRLQNRDAPLYLYVPAGMLVRAQDYAKAAGLKHVKFRTWRWAPNGMVVREP